MKHFLAAIFPAAFARNGVTGSLSWSLSKDSTTLTVRGKGAMPNYGQVKSPWEAYRKTILTVVIEPGVTGVGEYAFYMCTALVSVSLPNSLKRIGKTAFRDCIALASVSLPSGLTEIGKSAFACCYSLTSVAIPRSVTEIGEKAFASCSSLGRIDVEEGNAAFGADNGVLFSRDGRVLIRYPEGKTGERYAIPFGVERIGKWAFEGADLSFAEIPGSLAVIEEEAFYGCSFLKSVFIPRSVTKIGAQAFYCCRRLTTITAEAGNSSYSSADGVLFNYGGSTLIRYPEGRTAMRYAIPPGTVRIENYAFSRSDYLGSLSIPEGVTAIGVRAFESCCNLGSVSIPRSVRSIDSRAFYFCHRLQDVAVRWTRPPAISEEVFGDTLCDTLRVPPGAKALYEAAGGWKDFRTIVEDCGATGEITRSLSADGTTLTVCGEGAMPDYACGESPWSDSRERIRAAAIEPGVTSVGKHAFFGCTALASVSLPNSLKRIEESAFSNCSSLASVSIPEGVTAIGDQAFHKCIALEKVSLPSGLMEIGKETFAFCDSLTSVAIPRSVTEIGEKAFACCSSLSRISVEKGNTAFSSNRGVLFSRDRSLLIQFPERKADERDYDIPPGTVRIGERAFYGARFSSVRIPDSVTAIGEEAFRGCSLLESAVIPRSVTAIEDRAFAGCSCLQAVAVRWPTPPAIGEEVFGYTPRKTLYVPRGTKALYEAADGWKDFHIAVEYCDAMGTLSWSLSDDNATLTVCGEGAMPDCGSGESHWSDYREEIRAAVIEPGVTSVGKHAFFGCTALASVSLPDSLKRIEESTFSDCRKLASVSIPEGVTAIGDRAFHKCIALKKVSLPSGLTEIGKEAFAFCDSLTSVAIPRSVTEIGEKAFACCSSLSRISVEKGNTAFSSNRGVLFSRDGSLLIQFPERKADERDYDIPPGTVRIGEQAFYGARFSSVRIPDSVTAIGEEAFRGCSLLKSAVIPRSVTAIGDRAFAGCSCLQAVAVRWPTPPAISEELFDCTPCYTLYVPRGTKALYEAADGWKDFHIAVEYCDATGTLSWSLSDDNATLTVCGEGAMPDCGSGESHWSDYREEIRAAVIEPGVTSVGKHAFFGCTALASVSLPDSLKRIEESAFSNCSGLASVSIPEGVTAIGDQAFHKCIALEKVSLPSGLMEIGKETFAFCDSLTSVAIPRSVTEIGEKAFACCSSLSRISVEKGNTAFSSNRGVLFSRDGSLLIQYPAGKTDTHYAIPPGTVRIGNYAFYPVGFSSVEIPDSVAAIGKGAFLRCSCLTSVFIPRSVTEIGAHAFGSCSQLTAFTVEAGNTSYSSADGVLFSRDGSLLIQYPAGKTDTHYAIPPGTVRIEICAFSNAYPETVSIPEGVAAIGSSAFQNCNNLKSIVIPRSVTTIESRAFSECRRLRDITVRWPTPLAIGEYVFDRRDKTLHVPPGAKALYEAADRWKDFETIVEDSDPNVDIL